MIRKLLRIIKKKTTTGRENEQRLRSGENCHSRSLNLYVWRRDDQQMCGLMSNHNQAKIKGVLPPTVAGRKYSGISGILSHRSEVWPLV